MKALPQTLLPVLTVLLFSGCQHTRSILQMDSNSPSPFLGLQWSVDAGNPKSSDTKVVSLERDASVPAKTKIQPAIYNTESRPFGFVKTSTTTRQSGNVKFSLPRVPLEGDAQLAGEVEDILSRWNNVR